MILGRDCFPRRSTVAYCLCALANILVAIAAGGRRGALRRSEGTRDTASGRRWTIPASTTTSRPSASAADQPHALDVDLGDRRRGLSGDGHRLHPAVARSRFPTFIRDAIDYVSGPTTFFVGATLGFIAMLASAGSFANGWSPGESSTRSCSSSV